MTLPQLFDLSFIGRRDRPALDWQGRTYTFGDLDVRSARLARVLAARGLEPGDRLAVYLPNQVALVDLYLACARSGFIFVPVNILYRGRELRHIVADCEPRALVAASAPDAAVPVWSVEELAAEAAAAAGPDGPGANGPRGTGDRATAAGPAGHGLHEDTPAVLVYTSGTTGAAKGAILTHGNLVANASNLVTAWQIGASDRLLLALPLFHVHGLGNGLHTWLASGCRLRLLPRFDRETIAGELLAFETTLFFGVPAMYARLLEVDEPQARAIGRRMRLFVSGSAPLPPAVFAAFRARFGHDILERYGMSETLMTLSNPCAGERRPGTVGFPLPGVSVRLVDAGGKPAGPGETGELWVRSPTVCAGYWRNPAATREAFVEGWFRTGDLAARSEDGYYTLKGRLSDLVISGGFNVYPREVEECLEEHPDVAEAAVVGRPDAIRGEVPVAFVVPRSGRALDPAALEAHCRARIASFKVPRAFTCVEALPRNALGKVQKHLLTPSREAPPDPA
jgi:malonyl-CoA/methylmalonyl-CoA synthetase